MKNERPSELNYKTVNDTGFLVEKRCRLPELKFYEEDGSVLFWASVTDFEGEENEAMQYLTPEVAMKMAKALEACAIQALKNSV